MKIFTKWWRIVSKSCIAFPYYFFTPWCFVRTNISAHKQIWHRMLIILKLWNHLRWRYSEVVIAFCLCVSWTSDHRGLSIELGAFFAGVMVSTTPVAEETQNHINPVRNIFGALFLSSIGMIINPFFLWVHFDVLICTLMIIILFKCSVIALVVRAFGFSTRISFTVGISMAQIGEFSFVLLSRASNLGLVKHKFYLLLLGITAISLFTSPIILRYSPYLMSRLPRPWWEKLRVERVSKNCLSGQVWTIEQENWWGSTWRWSPALFRASQSWTAHVTIASVGAS